MHKVQGICFALQKPGHGMAAVGPAGGIPLAKKKGRAGRTVQPKSREETPKDGHAMASRTSHDAAVDMGALVLRCNLVNPRQMHIGVHVAKMQRGARRSGNA